MYTVHRLTEPPKTGVLKTEYEYWFENRDRLTELFPSLHVGIVGREVVAVSDSRHAVYGQVISKRGNIPMVIERADDDPDPGLGCSAVGVEMWRGIDSMMVALEQLAEEIEQGEPPAPSIMPNNVRAAAIRKAMFEYTGGGTYRSGSPYWLIKVLREEAQNFRKAPWEVAVTYLFEYWEFCLNQELKERMDSIPIPPEVTAWPRFNPGTRVGRLLNRIFPPIVH